MRQRLSQFGAQFGSTILILFILTLILAAWLNLRPSFYDFEVKEVSISTLQNADPTSNHLDNILLEHLSAFKYIKSFDHVLEKKHEISEIKHPLWIDRCEVSQAKFIQFMQWQQLHQEQNIASLFQPYNWEYKSNTQKHLISGKLSAAANGVSYYDAYAFCQATGGRLPYRDEWVAIASGQNGRLYPWGNEFDNSSWPFLDPLLNATQSCATHKNNATPEAVYDLGNNVSEWVQNRERPVQPIIIGGNAFNQPYAIYSLNFLYRFAPAGYRSPYVGFRCAYDTPPIQTPWLTRLKAQKITANKYPTGIPEHAKLPHMLSQLPREQIDMLLRIFERQKKNQQESLFVMLHEVTREKYASFVQDIFVKLKLYADENEPKNHNYLPPDWELQMQKPELPITNIDWWSAYAFANWAGGRLLTAEEWTIIASGRGQNIYPWGNKAPSHEMKNIAERGSNPTDVTLDGILDMGSNVSEWTQSIVISDGSHAIVVKGGNYLLPDSETSRIDFNNYVPEHYRSPTLGFRIAFDSKP